MKSECNFQIGARIHDLLQDCHADMPSAIRALNVDCVQLTLPKFVRWSESPQNYSIEKVQKIKDDFEKAKVDVNVLSCYVNPLAENVKKEQDTFCRFVDYASIMGVKIVGTETGSVVNDLRDYNLNHTEENFLKLIESLRPMVEYAAMRGITVGIESVAYYPVYDEKTFARLKNAFPEGSICCIFDPTNLLHIGNYQSQREIFEDFVRAHAGDIRVLHLKDFAVVNGWLEERPLFEGELDVKYVLELLKKYKIFPDLIVENAKDANNYICIKNKLKLLLEDK